MRFLRAPKGAAATSGEITPPIGAMLDYAGSGDPDGTWAVCDGRLLNATADPTLLTLFNRIGTTFGGSGQSSFALPDYRGRSHVGAIDMGSGAGPTGNARAQAARGAASGEVNHTITAQELPPESGANLTMGPLKFWGTTSQPGTGPIDFYRPYNNAMNNMQPYLAAAKIIRIR